MLLIACPHCGPRSETDFICGGETHVVRPKLVCSDDDWANYLFGRHNPRGITYERWRHVFGCGHWFNVARSTVDHTIHAVYGISDPKPSLRAESTSIHRSGQGPR